MFTSTFPDQHGETVLKQLKGQNVDRWTAITSYYHLLGWCLGQQQGKQAVAADTANNDYSGELQALMDKIKHNRTVRQAKVEYGLKQQNQEPAPSAPPKEAEPAPPKEAEPASPTESKSETEPKPAEPKPAEPKPAEPKGNLHQIEVPAGMAAFLVKKLNNLLTT